MRMLIDGEWVDAADGRADETRGRTTRELIGMALYSGVAGMMRPKTGGNAREGLRGILLDMTGQKTLLMSGVFPIASNTEGIIAIVRDLAL